MGFDNIDDYLKTNDYVGGILGRNANRIKGASFTLYGQTYVLNPTSWDTNHIHGGTFGFDKVVWAGNALTNGVEFFHSSPDGDEGQGYKFAELSELSWPAQLSFFSEGLSAQLRFFKNWLSSAERAEREKIDAKNTSSPQLAQLRKKS